MKIKSYKDETEDRSARCTVIKHAKIVKIMERELRRFCAS